MKKILFVRRQGVYLPEINAYMAFIREKMPHVSAFESLDINHADTSENVDIVWKFMGFDRAPATDQLVVHEYGSLSVGRFPRVKNFIKRQFTTKPALRVFLNETVRRDMKFADNVPDRLRDMGVSAHFFREFPHPNPDYDFVYAGSLNRGKMIISMLNHFKTRMKGATLLVIGTVPDEIHHAFGTTDNIIFTGRIKYEDMPEVMTRARYGLNIMPDLYPFNRQTSTKLLEYCAARMKVISTRYSWVEDFENHTGGKFFYLDQNFDHLDMAHLNDYPFATPCVEEYEWTKVIERSRVFESF